MCYFFLEVQLLGKVSERGGRCEGEATPLGGGRFGKFGVEAVVVVVVV